MSARTVEAFEPRVVAEFSESRGVSGWATVAGMMPRGGRLRAVLMPVMPSAYAETPVRLVVERQSFDAMGVPAWTSVPYEDEAYPRGVDAALTAILIELTTLQREKEAASTPAASAVNLHPPDLSATDDVQIAVLAVIVLAGVDDPLNPDWTVVEAGRLVCPRAWDEDRIQAEVAIRDWNRLPQSGYVVGGSVVGPRPGSEVHDLALAMPVTFFYTIDTTPAAAMAAWDACQAELGDRFRIIGVELPVVDREMPPSDSPEAP